MHAILTGTPKLIYCNVLLQISIHIFFKFFRPITNSWKNFLQKKHVLILWQDTYKGLIKYTAIQVGKYILNLLIWLIFIFEICSSDFNQDGKPDNITFMIKRIKVHTHESLKDPTYRFGDNYGVEKYLELFSGKCKLLE